MPLDLLEPIRLVVWDLDDTFWKGTLTEGGIEAFIEENHALVPALAKRGIMSSICSKNDHETVRAILEQHGLWEYFIFPSIDWSPKGGRVAAMVEAVGLRPPTVLFIDDNPNNRGEVAQAVPGIMVADETVVPGLAAHAMFQGKDDSGLTRLAQYKLLERKKEDEVKASGDNAGFLRSCGIQVTLEHDLEKHLDRVVELITRTNQLNFTKERLPEDPAEARTVALKQIRYFGHQGGLVKVTDRYGDYGYVGFYLKSFDDGLNRGTLKHFCFSCRTIGMGIEQWVYQTIGRPWLNIVGEVLSDVYHAPPVDWVNQAGSGNGGGHRLGQFTEIRMRGGCEISALAHYFKLAGPVTSVETNYVRDVFVVKLDVASSLVNLLSGDAATLEALAKLELGQEALRQSFFAPTTGPTLCVLNLWGELHIPMYRHRTLGFYVHLIVQDFMAWTETRSGGDFAAWTDAELEAQADTVGLQPDVRNRLFAFVAELRQNYDYAGQIQEQLVKENFRSIGEHIPKGATLALVLPSYCLPDGTANQRNINMSRWATEVLGDRRNVELIDIDRCIHAQAEREADYGDHFNRIVYFRVAEEIMRRVTPTAWLDAF